METLWVMPPCGEGEMVIQICSFLSGPGSGILSQCGFTFHFTKRPRASQPCGWCLSKDLVICSSLVGITGHTTLPRADEFGSNLLPPMRFGRVFFLNPVLNLYSGFRILTSLPSILKWDAQPLTVLISDENNLIGEAKLCDCSLLLLLLENGKEMKILSNEPIMTSCSPLPSPPIFPPTPNHWGCTLDPVFSSCTCPVVSPQIYKEQLNTRVVLVAVETWTEKDHIDITTNLVQMLHEFSKYRQRIKQHADAVHLISYVPTIFGLTFVFIPLF